MAWNPGLDFLLVWGGTDIRIKSEFSWCQVRPIFCQMGLNYMHKSRCNWLVQGVRLSPIWASKRLITRLKKKNREDYHWDSTLCVPRWKSQFRTVQGLPCEGNLFSEVIPWGAHHTAKDQTVPPPGSLNHTANDPIWTLLLEPKARWMATEGKVGSQGWPAPHPHLTLPKANPAPQMHSQPLTWPGKSDACFLLPVYLTLSTREFLRIKQSDWALATNPHMLETLVLMDVLLLPMSRPEGPHFKPCPAIYPKKNKQKK
jgi:hypothetical protein